MDAVILCELPADNAGARSWILDRVALLAITGRAELKIVGTEQVSAGQTATEAIAFSIASVERANAILSQWRQDAQLPDSITMKVLRTENVRFDAAVFP
jgi:hypothetical protein